MSLWLLLPAACAVLRLTTGRYVFSALTSLCCAAVIAGAGMDGGGGLVIAGLLISVAGDWLLAHPKRVGNAFLLGVACFAVGHVLFAIYAARRFRFSPWAAALVALLAAGYAVYLRRSVLPGQPAAMRVALPGYALVSLCGLFFALSMGAPGPERALYTLGIACILFSDTMIAEAEFALHPWARPWILPTYYLCHILIAASRLIR